MKARPGWASATRIGGKSKQPISPVGCTSSQKCVLARTRGPAKWQSSKMSIRVGIVGISGYGGGEAMRLVAGHPWFELVFAAGEGSAGSRLVDRFPGVPRSWPTS